MCRTVNLYYCTALPIIRTVLKNKACNIYKYWSYNRNLRVSHYRAIRRNEQQNNYIPTYVLKWETTEQKNWFLILSCYFRKESSIETFSQVIKKNRRRNNHAFTYISVTGQCCWTTCDRFGTCDDFGPGDEKSPRGQFIKSIRGFECWEFVCTLYLPYFLIYSPSLNSFRSKNSIY